jgi:LCP family protein required for cell wall assembly
MSDGENATPGQHGGDAARGQHGGDAARGQHGGDAARGQHGGDAARGQHSDAAPGPSGHHTEGVAVADLIAKVTGDPRVAPVTRRSADAKAQSDADATVPLPVAAIADEMPDLAGLARARRPLAANPDPAAARTARTTPDRPHRRALLAARAAAVLIAVSALAVTGAAWQWQSAKNKLLNTIAALDPNSSDIRDRNAQNGDENFLIIGVDSRIGMNGEMGAGDTSVAQGARSDTIMLVNIPANRNRVVAVSFPRDLAIAPMNCQAWDPETGKYGPVYDQNTDEWSDNERLTETKLNSAYALGGPKCLVKVIQKISGLAINRFMAVDFAGFSAMVDALGGVEVCSTTPLEDAELGTVLATAGRQKLDGPTALNYVRARSIATEDNGDYGRIKRQQLFLSSLLRSMISTETLFDISKLDDVVNTFIDDSYVDNIQTRDLVRLGQSLQGVNAGRITFVTVPTTGIADYEGNEQPRTEDISALFDAIIEDKPLPGENDNNETLNPVTTTTVTTTSDDSETSSSTTESTGATDTTSAESTSTEPNGNSTTSIEPTETITEDVKAVAADPRDVTVQVANVTEQSGLADTVTTELGLYGFNTFEPDYYSDWSTVTETTVFYSLGNEQAAATVAATLPGAQIERISGLGETIQVVLGPDFSGVKYPQASGTALTVSVTHAGSSTPTKLPSDLTVTNGADITCD